MKRRKGWEGVRDSKEERNGEKVDKKSKQRGKMDVGLLNEDGQNG